MTLIKTPMMMMIGTEKLFFTSSKIQNQKNIVPGLFRMFGDYSSTPRQMSTHKQIGISEQNIKAELVGIDLSKKIFFHGVDSVLPQNLIRNQITMSETMLNINQKLSLDLNSYENINVVGFGKAVLPMAEEVCEILGDRISKCVLSTPLGTRTSSNTRIEIFHGAKNNIPDQDAYKAAEAILRVVSGTTTKDLLFVLISGGGSALLPYPRPPATLAEKSELIKKLSLKGANIVELNTIRKRLSLVKGGGLVQLCPAKTMVSLILSDVLGDKLDIIGSGPTVEFTEETGKALEIAHKYLLPSEIPENISFLLRTIPETKTSREIRTENIIIGNNSTALWSAANVAIKQYSSIPAILTTTLEGDARDVGEQIAKVCHLISQTLVYKDKSQSLKPIISVLNGLKVPTSAINDFQRTIERAKQSGSSLCLLFGGETTVLVKGKGIGGRNQELALSAALALTKLNCVENVTIFSAGTDGIDGPCDAAGAVVSPLTISFALQEKLDAQHYLNNNDSYTFFKQLQQGKYHVITGHTGTNVMDMVIAIINPVIPKTNSSL